MNLSFLSQMTDSLTEIMRITKQNQDDVGYEVPSWACVINPGAEVTFLDYLSLNSQHQLMTLERYAQVVGERARAFVDSFSSPENISLYISINADHSYTVMFEEKIDGVVNYTFHLNRYALSDVFSALKKFRKEAA